MQVLRPTLVASKWPRSLRGREIVSYLKSISVNDVDLGALEEFVGGMEAELKLVPVSWVKANDAIRDTDAEPKQLDYDEMKQTSAPPLLVESDGTITDGYHRWRAMRKQGQRKCWVYVLNWSYSELFD